ncbi:MAG: O-antigen ligase family protein [Chitinophagaceae bacterium]
MLFNKVPGPGDQKWRNISLYLLAASIPFSDNLNSWCIIFFIITTILSTGLSEMYGRLRLSKLWIPPALFFLWITLTMFWDSSGHVTIKNIEGYATLLFIPMVLAASCSIPYKVVMRTCFSLFIATLLISLICLAKAWMEYRVTGDSRVFYYHYLSHQMGLNAVYLAAYCLAGLVWLLYFKFIDKAGLRLNKWLCVLIAIYLCIFIFMLSSKLAISLLAVSLIILFCYIGYQRGRIRTAIFTLLLLISVSAVVVYNMSYLRWRISVTRLKTYGGTADDQNGLAARLLMWSSAWELIKERPVQGYGVNGSKQQLLDKYREKDFKLGLQEKYNCHNQYLDSFLVGGVIGLGLLLAIIITTTVEALRYRNLLLLMILLQFVSMSVVEVTLGVQKGIVFYFFFIFLFYYHGPGNMKLSTRVDQNLNVIAG